MAANGRNVLWHLLKSSRLCPHGHLVSNKYLPIALQKRYLFGKSERGSDAISHEVVEKHRKGPMVHHSEPQTDTTGPVEVPRYYKHVHPDFLPDPNWIARDRIKEKLEREDMHRRRAMLEVPEFYVGSIMAVTVADPYSPGKKNRFVGICIDRCKQGLLHSFILRNVVDGIGVEINYDMYSPVIHSIETLRLEKRLDEKLYYLRDSPEEYSIFPFDMSSVPLPKGLTVPVNTTVIKLNPRPWHERWERQNLKGVELGKLPEKVAKQAKLPKHVQVWKKHDLMLESRTKIQAGEMEEIMKEVFIRQQKDTKKKIQKKLKEAKKAKERS